MTVLRRTPFVLRRFHSSASASSEGRLTVGIRREDPQRIWERRCPLTPEAVSDLVEKEGVRVLVQPCERRVWTMKELLQAGAEPHSTLSPAHVIIGIKETPLSEVLVDPVPLSLSSTQGKGTNQVPRTHMMFSHTHKGQHYNMELLSKFVGNGHAHMLSGTHHPRLIDYELLTDESGKRTVGFGWFAGVAGALESLSALAHAHLEIGVASPFLSTPRPHTHPSLSSLVTSLRTLVGDRIASEGTPAALGPIIIGVTGSGKVSQGCLDLLEKLPIHHVTVNDLPKLVTDPAVDLHKIYVVHAMPRDYFVRKDGGQYDRAHYYSNPDQYDSVFHERVAPYLSLLLNGAGWAQGFPRLMTNAQLASTLEAAQHIGKGRFACVGDISCDIEGGLEFLARSSTLSDPFYRTRPAGLPPHLPSVTMMAVDILPTALPREASMHFSSVLMPYLRNLIWNHLHDKGAPLSPEEASHREALDRATVAKHGELREEHKWLENPLNTWRTQVASQPSASSGLSVPRKKKVLMLGSGMVAGPAVDEIARHTDVELLVASNALSEAERLTARHANASARLLDVSDGEDVTRLVEASDVVISLLPVPFHPAIAEMCVKHGKHLVTASYISPDMRSLHDRAQAADVLLLNEIGLDPGIDHCSAISLLDKLRSEKKDVVSFTSFCGGLPAPECADVPLKYKFSWSPRGVLSAALNGARFKLGGKVQEISGKDILKQHFPELPISGVLKLEGIANRDSLPYADTYSLGKLDDMRTLLRGTIRYPGFSALMHAFKGLGLLEPTSLVNPTSWTDLTCMTMQTRLGSSISTDRESIRSAIADLVPKHVREDALSALDYFGVLPPLDPAVLPVNLSIPLPKKPTAPLDLFASVLADRLRYNPGERDLVLLHHEIIARAPSSKHEEAYTSSLVVYGDDKASAMARCVGLPLAFAVRRVLDGAVSARGVHGPGVEKAVWTSVLEGLENVGLGMKERVVETGGSFVSVEDSLSRKS